MRPGAKKDTVQYLELHFSKKEISDLARLHA